MGRAPSAFARNGKVSIRGANMTTISVMADFVTETSFDSLSSEALGRVKLHLLDTLGAMIAGPRITEGVAIGKLAARLASGGNVPVTGYSLKASLLTAVMASCAATRLTEIDDIHLESCTTPGAVIVPTAVSLAHAGYLADPRDFLVALAVGYELLIRMGVAIDGPNALYRGIWPTYLAAPLGSAAVTAKALRLDKKKTADALACALTMSTGVAGRIRKPLSSRWLTLGLAAQNGVIAAFSAAEGFAGDDALLDREDSGPLQALIAAKAKLLDGLGEKSLMDEMCIKPYPIARQALSAVEAFRETLAAHKTDPESIEQVTVFVPGQFVRMIDNPKMPENRMESILGVQYQIALAACEPARLLDFGRELLLQDDRISAMMAKVSVKPSGELEAYFPQVWPARVEVKTKNGVMVREVLYPRGDGHNPCNWDDVALKFKQAAFGNADATIEEPITGLVGSIDTSESIHPLLKSLNRVYNRKEEQ